MSRESLNPWANYPPERIPTKTTVPELETFLKAAGAKSRVLDLGCGDGRISRMLEKRGYRVVGVDINAAAIEAAAGGADLELFVRDLVSDDGLDLPGPPFRLVVCQLVISVVGGARNREALLRNAKDALEPGGLLYLSASGVSADINPGYRELYEADYQSTGERHTYFSRDGDGNILYETHHFEASELRVLLEASGLEVVSLKRKPEASSRRPDEAAYFLYAVARRPARGETKHG